MRGEIEFVNAKTAATQSSDITFIGFFQSLRIRQNNPGLLSCLARVFQLSCHRQEDLSLAHVLDASYEDDNQISSWTFRLCLSLSFFFHILMRLASQQP